ncbi:MAG: peptidylprolyl isomerase [Planctomycetes bacterium]|nr:peptidylprolyl isomerase [Planctomycetota bacterium]
MAAYLGWTYFKGSKESGQAELAKILFEAGSFIPDQNQVNYGSIPDLGGLNERRFETMASAFYRRHQPDTVGRENSLSIMFEPESAARYLSGAETAIAELEDQRSKFTDAHWEQKFLNHLQQLHFYCAVNCADVSRRRGHLEKQKAVLGELESKHADKGILSLKPFAESQDSLLDLWKSANAGELAACEILEKVGKIEIQPDTSLSATIELENGKSLKVRFFSEVAQKSVQNFLFHALAGRYDGTAFHRLDKDAGLFEFGSVFSREAPDRKFIWGNENPGYTIPAEGTVLMPVKRGSITTKPIGVAGHGLFYEIHVSPPERNNVAQAVIGEVTEGLEVLDEWLQTGIHDEVGVAGRNIPRVRLGIKKIVIQGEPEHKGEDSWMPVLRDMPLPDVSAAETRFEELLKGAESQPENGGQDAPKPDDADGDK